MEKILVTTDFSKHSKAGLRFAIQLATQKEVELVFFHCFQALIPTTLHRKRIENAIREQTAAHLKQLESFVEAYYKSLKVTPGPYRCAVLEDFSPESAILDYAHRNKFDLICISTRGAGSIQKIIGTNTSIVILKSSVPVLAVPHTYRVQTIKTVLYASDLENINEELSKVVGFAQSVKAKVDLAHFYYPGQILLDKEMLKAMWRQKHECLDQIFLEKFQVNEGFTGQLDQLVKKTKPSMIAFYTHTNKTWFDKLFSSSRSEAYSFVTKTPMLVFRKTAK
ncbi:MAG: universal stress protein [Saprospiraceae bacterium]|jgi:nucleotide-binding universal stress UspA family protein|nr:universal stress protein [Lewinellaceae bacterium]MBP6810932.1 universal stress protein [Saprospiraceae bacterium]